MTEETKVVEGEVTPVEAPVVTEATLEATPAEVPAVEAAPEVVA
ncbi:MAG: hypothetical protein WCO12_01660 [bacterium]